MAQTPDSPPNEIVTDEKTSIRERVHEIIFESHTILGAIFDISLLIAIMASIAAIALETVDWPGMTETEQENWRSGCVYAQWVFTILFTIEYVLRVYCVKKPFRYIFSFWGIIDLLSILPDYVVLLFGWGNSNHFSVIRSLRLLRVFRILKLSWFQGEADELGNAIWKARGKIAVFLFVVLITVTVAGTIMYEVENFAYTGPDGQKTESQFTSIPTGIYWAIVTMTTVGFGDIVPVTPIGKVISAVLILVGYSMIIVPTGFVSAEVIESRRRKTATTISCSSCVTEGHDTDAIYCKYCSEKL